MQDNNLLDAEIVGQIRAVLGASVADLSKDANVAVRRDVLLQAVIRLEQLTMTPAAITGHGVGLEPADRLWTKSEAMVEDPLIGTEVQRVVRLRFHTTDLFAAPNHAIEQESISPWYTFISSAMRDFGNQLIGIAQQADKWVPASRPPASTSKH